MNLAFELGATDVINALHVNPSEEITRITNGGAHYAIESSGVASLVAEGVRSLRVRGTLAVVGVSGEVTLHIHDDLIPPNRTVIGVTQGNSIPKLFIPQLIQYYKENRFPFDRLIRVYPHTQLDEAITDMKTGKTIKPVISFV